MTRTDPTDVPRPNAQLHFGVFFQGVNHWTIWSDPTSGSQIAPESYRQVAQTAERGLFDAFFLGEGLRLREVRRADPRPRHRRPPGRDHPTRRAGRADRADRAGLDLEHDLQRAGRPRPPAGRARPALRGPRRLERRHHRQRVDRRELPPWRLPRPRRPLPAGRGVPRTWPGRSGTAGPRRDRDLARRAVLGAPDAVAGCAYARRPVRRRARPTAAAQRPGAPGDLPGRRLRARAATSPPATPT